jgi:hypothetical protein
MSEDERASYENDIKILKEDRDYWVWRYNEAKREAEWYNKFGFHMWWITAVAVFVLCKLGC